MGAMNTTLLVILIVIFLVIEKIMEDWLFKKYPKAERLIDQIGLLIFIGSIFGFVYSVVQGVDPSHFIVAAVVSGKLAISTWTNRKQNKKENPSSLAESAKQKSGMAVQSTQDIAHSPAENKVWYKNRYVLVGGIFLALMVIGAIVGDAPKSNSNNDVPSVTDAFSRVLKYETSEWTEYSSPSAHFTTKFPQHPQRKETTVFNPDVQQNMTLETYFAGDKDDSYYLVNYTEYPVDFVLDQDTKSNLEVFLNNTVATGQNNKLLSSSFTTYKGFDAVTFEMYQASTQSYYKGLLTIRGQRSYQLLTSPT